MKVYSMLEQHDQNLRATSVQMALAINQSGPVEKIMEDAKVFYAFLLGVPSQEPSKVLSPKKPELVTGSNGIIPPVRTVLSDA